MNKEIEIIYEDNDIIVCRKPAGLAVQSASVMAPDMESMLKNRLYRQKGKKESSDIYIIHRLDQPVEGIVVFAKNKKAAGILSQQVKASGGMNKIYMAEVYGKLPDDKREGELQDYIIKDSKTRCAKIVDETVSGAKKALLKYRVISEKKYGEAAITTAEIQLMTGRFHQIRAQFSHIGYPLLGDRRYGTPESNEFSEKLEIKNVALCAYKLSFMHPSGGKLLEFEIKPSLKL